jgi:hypothetical protein
MIVGVPYITNLKPLNLSIKLLLTAFSSVAQQVRQRF